MKLYFCSDCGQVKKSKNIECDNCGDYTEPIEGDFTEENGNALLNIAGLGDED